MGQDAGASGRVADAVGGDTWLLLDIVQAVLRRAGDVGWAVEPRGIWCGLRPPDAHTPAQGWKLHVSATQLSAPVVLARAAEVLVREGCAFKFSRDLPRLGALLSNRCERGSGGKFITAYPVDDEQFRRLAASLDAVTDGLPGPVILSDRPLRPGSLVHYRYGVFNAEAVLTDEGSFESMLTAPDGQRVKDERQAWFSPPDWAKLPFAGHETVGVGAGTAGAAGQDGAAGTPADRAPIVLVGDRFVVRRAIRHSYRGGVFRAVDQQTGIEVVLKQARPHVMGTLQGTDARDVLRHEAEVLDLLGPLGLAPRKVALVIHQNNLFLAEELVPGVTLHQWTADLVVDAWQGRGAPPDEAVDLAGQLIEIMAGVHAQGLVLRDLSPANVMLTPQDRLRLIDLEYAVPVGSRVAPAYTVGFVAPEVTATWSFGPAPAQQSDLFSLGASILYLASGIHPELPADDPVDRPGAQRLEVVVSRLAEHMPAVRRLAPLVLGLMRDDPQRRWTLTRAQAFLTAPNGAGSTGIRPDGRVPDARIDRLLADGLDHIVRTMAPQERRLWAGDEFADTTDSCNVQYGAAGVLAVLTRAASVLDDDRLRAAVATAADWIDQRLFDIPRILPGLYLGRSGTAWSLYDAARLLGDDKLTARALGLAHEVPVRWPNPDILHGAAGAGLALLHLWRATDDPQLLRRAATAADCVLNAATERGGRLLWPTPEKLDPNIAHEPHYGFAHGVAGAGAFLLYAGLATGRQEYLDAARRAGDTLSAVADIDAGAARWPILAEDDAGGKALHWCSGSAGVGTFLIRLWAVTGDQRHRELAEGAAVAIHRNRWYSNSSTCHGLSGHGDFLIDLAGFTADQRYLNWAWDLAAVIDTRNSIRDGLMLIPDESGQDVVAGYNTGLSGVLGFLLRLRHGGPRWWMADELLSGPVGTGADGPSRHRPARAAACALSTRTKGGEHHEHGAEHEHGHQCTGVASG